VAVDDGRDRENEADPELPTEHVRVVTMSAVTIIVRATFVMVVRLVNDRSLRRDLSGDSTVIPRLFVLVRGSRAHDVHQPFDGGVADSESVTQHSPHQQAGRWTPVDQQSARGM
jgi:hypothetical protein